MDVKFENQGTQLTGSFRKPEPGRKGGGPYPAVAFVDGSGPAERDGWDDEAEALVAKAHRRCPYSRATRGNVDVRLTLR